MDLAGFSLDIESAHKSICVKDMEHGLLGFTLDSKLNSFTGFALSGPHSPPFGGRDYEDAFFVSSANLFCRCMQLGYT